MDAETSGSVNGARESLMQRCHFRCQILPEAHGPEGSSIWFRRFPTPLYLLPLSTLVSFTVVDPCIFYRYRPLYLLPLSTLVLDERTAILKPLRTCRRHSHDIEKRIVKRLKQYG